MKCDRKRLECATREMGAVLFGVADLGVVLRKEPEALARLGKGFARAVVAGVRLQEAVLDTLTDGPTPLYFHNYRQVNYQLDSIALVLADMIQRSGHRAMAVPASQVIQREPMLGHLSHRLTGWAAGLGHRGRNNLLVNPEYGSQVRYVTVLTDMPLRADKPVEGSCGDCMACVPSCPAGAIADAPEGFNLAACYAKLCEFTRRPFIGQHICGLCLKACPGRLSAGRATKADRRGRSKGKPNGKRSGR